eukprot:scaffold8381_cov40-Prasinocladus_malaysianus.AAC.3
MRFTSHVQQSTIHSKMDSAALRPGIPRCQPPHLGMWKKPCCPIMYAVIVWTIDMTGNNAYNND